MSSAVKIFHGRFGRVALLDMEMFIRGRSRDRGLSILLVEHEVDLVMSLSVHLVATAQGCKLADPKLLLIDEPTERRAPMIVDELFTRMSGLARDGIPIVLVEQNVDRAIELASRFYVLERGQVVLEGRAGDAGDRERLLAQIAV